MILTLVISWERKRIAEFVSWIPSHTVNIETRVETPYFSWVEVIAQLSHPYRDNVWSVWWWIEGILHYFKLRNVACHFLLLLILALSLPSFFILTENFPSIALWSIPNFKYKLTSFSLKLSKIKQLNNKMKLFKTITYLSILTAVAAMSFEKRRSNIQAQNYFKDIILARSKASSFTIQTRIQMQKEGKFRQSLRKLLGKDKPQDKVERSKSEKNQFQSKDLGSKNRLEKFRG